ncbi:MAG TPA: hypothetical protein VFK39_04810 [Gemmatimonadaceae bacterium]|nr:hypothetical protein [Gemmatimonadaceae bacterium]
MNVEGRERFFRAIAERIDVDRVAEVHVFPAIRQGGRESGVAVVTLRPQPPESEAADQVDGAEQPGEVGDSVEARDEALDAPLHHPPRRFTVLRANYRLQLKGPDRGKWEVGVVEEADAPAATVDEVVRGVHERAGSWSVEGPERLTGDEFRAALVEEPWSATR